MVPKPVKDHINQWLIALLVGLLVSGCGLYIKWLNDTIRVHEDVIRDMNSKLTGMDTKLDLILAQYGIKVPKK